MRKFAPSWVDPATSLIWYSWICICCFTLTNAMKKKRGLPAGDSVKVVHRSSRSGSVETIRLVTMRLCVPSLASLSGLRIQHSCELWCRLQTWLGSGVAVAVA